MTKGKLHEIPRADANGTVGSHALPMPILSPSVLRQVASLYKQMATQQAAIRAQMEGLIQANLAGQGLEIEPFVVTNVDLSTGAVTLAPKQAAAP